MVTGVSRKYEKQFKQFEQLINVLPHSSPICLQEPNRANLSIATTTVEAMDGDFMLETVLIDHFIKCGINTSYKNDSIVSTTSAVEPLIDHLLERSDRGKDWYGEKRQSISTTH